NNVQEAEMIEDIKYQRELQRQQEQMDNKEEQISHKDSGIIGMAAVNVAAVEEYSYRYIKNCPISKNQQKKIFKICAGANISFEFVMALIWKESGWDAKCVSDNGESVGLMQIQERWHRELMDKLGCSDLKDPEQNVRVGVELLKRQFKTYREPAWALMAYNGGGAYADRMIAKGEISEYANKVLQKTQEYEKENGLCE
ncbi:MAG: lytic transglycosylase domain-containing protein, partial [Wujia sp.]